MIRKFLACCAIFFPLITFNNPAQTEEVREKILQSHSRLPLYFIENQGQLDKTVAYYVASPAYNLYFTSDGVVFDFKKHTIYLDLGKDLKIKASQKQETRINYFIGNDPSKWKTNIPTYGKLIYKLHPGIDLAFYGDDQRLKYEFVIEPAADHKKIQLSYRGIDALKLSNDGDLIIKTALGELKDAKPYAYQLIDGKKKEVDACFNVDGCTVSFKVEGYDPCLPLIIDPELTYSTFLGGSGNEISWWIDFDSSGNVYLVGQTASTNFPTTSGAYDTSQNGGDDAFVFKLDSSGSSLVWFTYLGGSGGDIGYGIEVDSSGNVYVTGETASTNFPTTSGAYDTSQNGGADTFIAKLDASGSTLVYSTFLGGSGTDSGWWLVIDSGGSAYVTGYTESSDFPTTSGAYDTSFNGGRDAYVTKLNASGSALAYSTYIGGSAYDYGNGIKVDSSGNAYVTGQTASTDFPTTSGAYDTTHNGSSDVFITKLDASGSTLLYSTFLGGSGSDQGYGMAIDSSGNAYVTGPTDSSNFPTTSGAFDTTYNGGTYDAFIVKLNSSGSILLYSTFLGGSGYEYGYNIAVDSSGNAYLGGYTSSSDFPTTSGAYDTSQNGGDDVFVMKIDVTAPEVISVSPKDGTSNASVDTKITATFSEAMDSSTINTSTFIVNSYWGTATGTVSYDSSSKTATFTHLGRLHYATHYSVTITTGVKDVAGNSMLSNYSWSFWSLRRNGSHGICFIRSVDLGGGAGSSLKYPIIIMFCLVMIVAAMRLRRVIINCEGRLIVLLLSAPFLLATIITIFMTLKLLD